MALSFAARHGRDLRWLGTTLGAVILAACTIDFDKYDPTLQGGQGGDPSSTVSAGGAAGCTPGAIRTCYEGPAGTEGVGVCRAGEQTCDDDGSDFGPCEGAVEPGDERCDTPTDDDCDGTVNEPAAGCGCVPGEPFACYDGAPGTAGIGMCQAGVQICGQDGQSLSALCYGAVEPQHEDCATTGDDDCDGTTNDHCGTVVNVFGENNGQFLWRARSAPSDGFLLAGSFLGQLDYGSGVYNADYLDGHMASLTNEGSVAFSVHIVGPGEQRVTDARLAGGGDDDFAFLIGNFNATTTFGGSAGSLAPLAGLDGYVLKASSLGAPEWVIPITSTDDVIPRAVAVAKSGAVFVGGEFSGTATFGKAQDGGGGGGGGGGGPGATPPDGSSNGFIMRVDPTNGDVVWVQTFGGTEPDRVEDIAFDNDDNLIVVGTFDEEATIGAGAPTLTDVGSDDGFVAKLDQDGNNLWAVQVGGAGVEEVHTVAVASDDSVFVGGHFTQALLVDGAATNAIDGEDAFVRKLTADGVEQWTAIYGGLDDQQTRSLTLLAGDALHAGVLLAGQADFGSGFPLISGGQNDIVLVAIDANGATSWARRFGDLGDQGDAQLGVGPNGTLWVGSTCNGTIDFGDGAWPTNSSDLCVGQVTP